MRQLKDTFNDRLTAQQEAKKALLAKMKPKPMVVDPDFEKRQVERVAEKEAARLARIAEREAARAAKIAAELAAIEATKKKGVDAEQEALFAKRDERKERKAAAKAEARAKREAKSAMRR